jgi:hypothetical protein
MSASAANQSNETDVNDESDVDMCSRITPPVKFNKVASFFALGVITIIRIATFWQQKSIGYFYGFRGAGI